MEHDEEMVDVATIMRIIVGEQNVTREATEEDADQTASQSLGPKAVSFEHRLYVVIYYIGLLS